MTNSSTDTVTLEGVRFRLIPFRVEDITVAYLSMLNNPKINRFLEVRWTPQTYESVGAYVRSYHGREEKYMWGIYARENALFVGTTTLSLVDRHTGSAELGLMVGLDSLWGKGASEETITLIQRHAFTTLKLRRLTAGSYAVNHGINFTLKRTGFRCEGRLVKAGVLEPGVYVDSFKWAILEEEWRGRENR